MKNNVLYKNLRAEMARNNITIKDMAEKLGFNRDTLARKLSGKSPIYLDEAFAIQIEFFPKNTIYELFMELVYQI